jgi:hypothetical protein
LQEIVWKGVFWDFMHPILGFLRLASRVYYRRLLTKGEQLGTPFVSTPFVSRYDFKIRPQTNDNHAGNGSKIKHILTYYQYC